MKKPLIYLLAFLLIAVIIFFAFYFYGVNQPLKEGGEDVYFNIEKGDNPGNIAESLEKKGLINSSFYFKMHSWLRGAGDDFKAGNYVLNTSMPIKEIMTILINGESAEKEVTIKLIDGWTMEEIGIYLEKKNLFSRRDWFEVVGRPDRENVGEQPDFKEYRRDFEFLKSKPVNLSLEGYLFPDTYRVYKSISPKGVARKMLQNFKMKITPKMMEDIKRGGNDLHEIITMASIIQKEVATEEDMRIVSGIFWKRIENDQTLGASATLGYISGEKKAQYNSRDTKQDSPYNTYANKGLPPGPICSPGLQAIEAAIYPIETDYNYFLNPPGTGETVYSKTFNEHIQNKQKYLK